MSAFVVSKQSVSVLVAAGAEIVEQPIQPEHLNALGQALLNECVRSVSHRYPGDIADLPGSFDVETIPGTDQEMSIAEWLTPYEHTAPSDAITRERLREEIGRYEYQSCEHPEWEASWAAQYVRGLRNLVEHFPTECEIDPEPEIDPEEERRLYGDLSRAETIKRIRLALKRRSGKTWSVTGGSGTGYGWICIDAPPKRRTGKHVADPSGEFGKYVHVDTGVPQEFGIMTPADAAELAALLGLEHVHHQGVSIPSSHDYYREYIDRAEGRSPAKLGAPYWD